MFCKCLKYLESSFQKRCLWVIFIEFNRTQENKYINSIFTKVCWVEFFLLLEASNYSVCAEQKFQSELPQGLTSAPI